MTSQPRTINPANDDKNSPTSSYTTYDYSRPITSCCSQHYFNYATANWVHYQRSASCHWL